MNPSENPFCAICDFRERYNIRIIRAIRVRITTFPRYLRYLREINTKSV